MKQNLWPAALIALVLVATGVGLGAKIGQDAPAPTDEANLGSEFALAVRNYPNDDPATTTVSYLTAGSGTVKYVVPIEDADLIDANLTAQASTTATVFRWTLEFSHDYDPSDGTGSWFGADATSVAIASTTHSVQTHENQWTPANAAATTTMKNFSVDPVASKFARFTFYTTGANGAVHLDTIIRKPLGGR